MSSRPKLLSQGLAALSASAMAVCVSCATPEADTGTTWVVSDQDLGPKKASGRRDMDLSDPATSYLAAEQFVPMLDWEQPGIMIPKELWGALLRPTVSDSGICPIEEVSGGGTVYRSYGCRSSQGYAWSGEVSEDRWEASGWSWERYDFDIEVLGDTDDVAFDRIALHGAVVFVDGREDSVLKEAVLVNVSATAEGWLSRADLNDPRETLWQDWRATGRYELSQDGNHRLDLDADLASLGSVTLQSQNLQVGCHLVPDGTLRLRSTSDATMQFRGATDCRRCAGYTVDGAELGDACGVGD